MDTIARTWNEWSDLYTKTMERRDPRLEIL
jgi:hypothetical protein